MIHPKEAITKYLANIVFIKCDIRKTIQFIDIGKDPIDLFHLAAVCREPGYEWEEYFSTNYIGTKNVCEFALENKIANIIYTSTMMVYKAGEKRYSEEDLAAPDTAYGISKLLAEEVLLNWKNRSANHRLRIIRPGVVFGKGEGGNYTKLYRAIKRNIFFYVGKNNTIKGSIYVKELINFLMFLREDLDDRIIYNFVFPKDDKISNICMDICDAMGMKKHIFTLPFRLLLITSYLFEILNQIGIKNPIHHRRIEKLYYSSFLSVDAAMAAGYKFAYTLRSAIEDWKQDCSGKGLY